MSCLIYMSDTGNGRIVSFDPKTATDAQAMSALENVDGLNEAQDLNGGELKELVAASYGMLLPSGLTLHGSATYASDNETGTLHKFALDGKPLGKLLVPGLKSGALAGLAFGPDDKLYFVDMVDERVLRLDNEF
jgi:hypothetical protein